MLMVFTRKNWIFMGYVSFREGKCLALICQPWVVGQKISKIFLPNGGFFHGDLGLQVGYNPYKWVMCPQILGL